MPEREREPEREKARAPRIPRLRPTPEFALKVPLWAPLTAAALFVAGLGAFLSPRPAPPAGPVPVLSPAPELPAASFERLPAAQPRESRLWQAPERQPAWTEPSEQPGGMEAGSLGWGDAEKAPAPQPAAKPGPAWPHLRRVANLAGITAPADGVGEQLRASVVDNKRVIEARPMAPGEAVGVPLVKRPKCAPGAYRIPPCSWKVERRGGACLDERGVVTTQEGPSGRELPALRQGRVIPYAYSAEGLGCEP